jgi:hypothetical protein
MSERDDDELAQEGTYYCPVCDTEKTFKAICWQAMTLRRVLNFEAPAEQVVLCCETCQTPLNHF